MAFVSGRAAVAAGLKELTDQAREAGRLFRRQDPHCRFRPVQCALNSGIRKMAIATQYKAHSLIRHCQRGWSFFRAERNEYLDILPASQRVDENELVCSARPMR